MRKPIITLDGPAGAGKSTVARLVAKTLGLRFLDTGAMYRAVTWKARKLGLTDPLAIAEMIRSTRLTVDPDRVTCDGEDVTRAIREPQVTAAVRPIADSPECRAELVRMQREIGRSGGLVTEGRDQGSIVFPDAEFLEVAAQLDQVDRHGTDLSGVLAVQQLDADGPCAEPVAEPEPDSEPESQPHSAKSPTIWKS